jgi:hypothetical protein
MRLKSPISGLRGSKRRFSLVRLTSLPIFFLRTKIEAQKGAKKKVGSRSSAKTLEKRLRTKNVGRRSAVVEIERAPRRSHELAGQNPLVRNHQDWLDKADYVRARNDGPWATEANYGRLIRKTPTWSCAKTRTLCIDVDRDSTNSAINEKLSFDDPSALRNL